MQLKPGARPARALPVGAQAPFTRPTRNNRWVTLNVLKKGGESTGCHGRAAPDPKFQLNRYG
jgi:hypothetical protein